MSTEHHDLAGEFPKHSEKIHIVSNTSFEKQKKKRAQLKIQLNLMIVA